MEQKKIKTKIFLDGGDPNETQEIITLLGFLDGQTTNPTLISKNPDAKSRIEKDKKFGAQEVFSFYKKVVKKISSLIPEGSVSVEVYADKETKAKNMFLQGKEMFSWIPNAHIKFPTTAEGLKAAKEAVANGMRVNMTLCFTQEQAAAVYSATKGAKVGQVFVSPFVGRLDDKGENGMDLIRNIIKMYKKGDGHVNVLTASVRNMHHFLYAIKLESDIITAPFSILKEWSAQGMPLPKNNYIYTTKGLKEISYREIDITKNWEDFDIVHELTDKGVDRFSDDWNKLIK